MFVTSQETNPDRPYSCHLGSTSHRRSAYAKGYHVLDRTALSRIGGAAGPSSTAIHHLSLVIDRSAFTPLDVQPAALEQRGQIVIAEIAFGAT